MKTTKWLAIIGMLVVFGLAWELNRVDQLGVAMWSGYVALAVMVFTAAWVTVGVVGVVQVYRLAVRGDVENKLDLVRSAQVRWDRVNSGNRL